MIIATELINQKAEAVGACAVEAEQDGYTRDERELIRLGRCQF